MRRLTAAIALAGALAATAVYAGSGKTSDKLDLPLEGVLTEADLNAPSNEQMEREYPPLALTLGLSGDAAMTCEVDTTGLLGDCKLDSENPVGLGFGAAALRLAPYFTAKPESFDGKPLKGTVTIPIHFKTEAPEPVRRASIPPPTSPAALTAARELADVEQWASRLHEMADQASENWTARVAQGGDAVAATRIVDAYRMGLNEAIPQEIDERERLLAADMTVEQIDAAVAFMKSPAGAAYQRAEVRLDDPKRDTFWRNAIAAARAHLCAQAACAGEASASPAS